MKQRRKDKVAVLLSAALAVTLTGSAGMPGGQVPEAYAAVVPGESISLGDGNSVTLDEAGKTVRVYGDAGTVYDVPIKVMADCTVLLDHIMNTADLTVADGVDADIIIRGKDGQGSLTAGEVACAKTKEPVSPEWNQEPEIGASLDVEGCTLICGSLGCGEDGRAWHGTLLGGDSTVCRATKGGHASPMVTVRDATLEVAGSIACGGSGASEITADSHAAAEGGRGGEVILVGSRVSVGGDVALGGAGGTGVVEDSQVEAGAAGTSGNVTILNGSIVEVAGNVGTQPDLADESFGGTEDGQRGGTVIVQNASLTCKDLASGGAGIGKTACREENGTVFYEGTDGGGGGELIAQNATVICETACNGGDAGACCLPADAADSHTQHPADGMGGRITATDSRITVRGTACRPGTRWEGFGGSQPLYNNSTFTGGVFTGGTVYGAVITTDLTTIVSGDFSGKLDIRNPAGESAAKCVLDTAADMAGQTVEVAANAATGTALLNDAGQLVTYLAVGKNTVRVKGTDNYAGTFVVEQPGASNVFTLEKQKTDAGGEGTKVVFPVPVTGGAVTVIVGGGETEQEPDEDGNIEVSIGAGVTEVFVIIGDTKYRYPVKNGTPGKPSIVGPAATLSGDTKLKEGVALCLTVDAAPSLEKNTLAYAWYKDGAALAATGSVLRVEQVMAADAGSYHAMVTESNGQRVTTETLAVTVAKDDAQGGGNTGNGGGSENDGNTGTGSGGNGNTGTGSGGNGNTGTGSGGNGSTGTGTGSGANTGGGGSGGAGAGGGTSAGGGAGSGSGASSGGSGGAGTGDGGTAGSSSGGNASGGAVSGGGISGPDSPISVEHTAKAPRIRIRSNVGGLKLVKASVKNTYKKYSRKTVRIQVLKERGCTYYYKVVEKGRHNRTVRWKRLSGDVVRVAASDTAKRVYLKAVGRNGKTAVRKTNGFYVDNRKPTVRGVKNKGVYHRAVTLRFFDNIRVKSALLNGKKVKSGYRAAKNGAYKLVVTDQAGNRSVVLFTIRR